jgi:hypothetical protein
MPYRMGSAKSSSQRESSFLFGCLTKSLCFHIFPALIAPSGSELMVFATSRFGGEG